MKAVILAAGYGRRLWPLTADKPKCLLTLGGLSILEHQLRGLQNTAADVAVIVCGFGFEQVRAHLASSTHASRVRLLFNPFFALADNLMSLWTARAELDDDLLLLNGDAVFHHRGFQLLNASQQSCCLLLARKRRYVADDMKVHLEEGRITAIGKHLMPERTHAVSIGAVRVSRQGVHHLRDALDASVLHPRALNSHFPAVIQLLVDQGHAVHCEDLGDLPWVDVDTPEDLRYARQCFGLPRHHINGSGQPKA